MSCKPTREGDCDCEGAIITCGCGVCVKCGRIRKAKQTKDREVFK